MTCSWTCPRQDCQHHILTKHSHYTIKVAVLTLPLFGMFVHWEQAFNGATKRLSRDKMVVALFASIIRHTKSMNRVLCGPTLSSTVGFGQQWASIKDLMGWILGWVAVIHFTHPIKMLFASMAATWHWIRLSGLIWSKQKRKKKKKRKRKGGWCTQLRTHVQATLKLRFSATDVSN